MWESIAPCFENRDLGLNNFFYEYPNLLTTLKETTSQGKLGLKRYCFSLQIVSSGRTPIGIMAEQNVASQCTGKVRKWWQKC